MKGGGECEVSALNFFFHRALTQLGVGSSDQELSALGVRSLLR